MIGLTALQVSIVLAPLLAMYMPLDPVFWIIILMIGIIPTIGGVYVMHRWYHSGE
jgi:disulfide bond formation protein DsbB